MPTTDLACDSSLIENTGQLSLRSSGSLSIRIPVIYNSHGEKPLVSLTLAYKFIYNFSYASVIHDMTQNANCLVLEPQFTQ